MASTFPPRNREKPRPHRAIAAPVGKSRVRVEQSLLNDVVRFGARPQKGHAQAPERIAVMLHAQDQRCAVIAAADGLGDALVVRRPQPFSWPLADLRQTNTLHLVLLF